MNEKPKHPLWGLAILFGIVGVIFIIAVTLTVIVVDRGWLPQSKGVIIPLIGIISLATAWTLNNIYRQITRVGA